MKKLLVGLSLLALSATASAGDFFGGDGEWKMGPYGPYYDESDWPEWTPMYWMDEFMNEWDNDEDYGGFGGMPPFMGGGYPGMMPYGGMPMGYGAPMPMMYPQAGMAGPMMPSAPMGNPMMMQQPMPAPQMMGMGAPLMAPPMPMAPQPVPGNMPGPGPMSAPAPMAAPAAN